MNLKIMILRLLKNLYKILKYTTQSIVTESRPVVSYGWGWGIGNALQKGMKKVWGVMGTLIIFDCDDGFTYVKTHKTEHFNCMHYIVSQLYLN